MLSLLRGVITLLRRQIMLSLLRGVITVRLCVSITLGIFVTNGMP